MNSSSKTRIISSTDTSVQKENEMNNHAESKTTGEQVIKDSHEKKKKKKKTDQRKIVLKILQIQ